MCLLSAGPITKQENESSRKQNGRQDVVRMYQRTLKNFCISGFAIDAFFLIVSEEMNFFPAGVLFRFGRNAGEVFYPDFDRTGCEQDKYHRSKYKKALPIVF